MISKSFKWVLLITFIFSMIIVVIYLSIFIFEKGMYAYEVVHCPSLRWVFPFHEFDTETGREWNTLKVFHLSGIIKEELAVYAMSNKWNDLPIKEELMDDLLLREYPDEYIVKMRNTQKGFWMDIYNSLRRRYLCLIDMDNSLLYIRSSSVF